MYNSNPHVIANLNTLEQCLSRISFYQNLPKLRADCQNIFYNITTLRPAVDMFKTPNGNVTLFFLTGVVRITYSGANYNIPVTIFFDPPYPVQPPRVFVTPTSDMVIKPRHRCVDTNGRVTIPQLTNWNPYQSNLIEVVGILSSIFSAEPPVNSVSKQLSKPAPTPPPPTVIAAPRPPPPQARDEGKMKKEVISKLTTKIQNKIRSEKNKLNSEKTQFNSKISEIAQQIDQFSKIKTDINSYKSQLQFDLSELKEWHLTHQSDDLLGCIQTESPMQQQLIDLYAEELAYEDLIEEIMKNEKSGLNEKLKEIRNSFKKLFEIKILKSKILSSII